MNTTNVFLNVHSEGHGFQLKHLRDIRQYLLDEINTSQFTQKKYSKSSILLNSFSKISLCIKLGNDRFRNAFGDSNLLCERHSEHMSRSCQSLYSGRVKHFKT